MKGWPSFDRYVIWKSPLGLPIVQPYRCPGKKQFTIFCNLYSLKTLTFPDLSMPWNNVTPSLQILFIPWMRSICLCLLWPVMIKDGHMLLSTVVIGLMPAVWTK
ncbi:hypothetical protein BCR42DRAFT_69762 [Absidia repens]|uniref:Uncharacterized protein n=1 Tax=Absidia repens TaxID=90262 RepID=A0A1X2ICB4_9FUNG|nr:hypothetical protein BCR42DRAFT_69762 [Absidia repens]